MEPNNIEQKFREKLNQREIQPAKNSWDRLDAMLTVADPSVSELAKQKPKRNYRWMYVAASFLGFILIATVFLSQTEEVIDAPNQKMVLEQNKVKNNENKIDEVLEIPATNATEVTITTQKAFVNQVSKSNLQPKLNPTIVQKTPVQTSITSKESAISAPIISQKTSVKVDVNALLASVEREKTLHAFANKTIPIKINSNDLLSQVDNELELSFREKVIQSVNKKYKEVKVAVINRNAE